MMNNSLLWLAALAAAALASACGGAGGGAETSGQAMVDAPPAQPVASKTDLAGVSAAAVSSTRIMLLGDSITYGYDGQSSQGGYRTNLWNMLQNDGVKVDFVGSLNDGSANLGDKDHEGHYGWRIAGISGSINGWLDTYKPEVIALMIGTNDVVFDGDAVNSPARLGNLIDQITTKRPDTKLLVASITPEGDANADARVRAYNAAIPGLVRARANAGKHVAFVNMNAALRASDHFDGTHPNPGGYNKMSIVWHNALLPLLRERNVSLPLNTIKSFQVATPGFTNRYLRHQNGLAFTSVVNSASGQLDKLDATFKVVRGLADPNCYSLQSVNYTNDYLRHTGARIRKDPFVNNDGFKQDATWCARAGASGKGVSFESLNYPGYYMRHYNSEMWLASGADLYGFDGFGPFIDDITWTMTQPLVPNS
jgi:lysophospholipase L1-like esterase